MTDAKNTGNFTAIDTETTGLSWSKCEVIEVGAVRFRDWKPVETYNTLVKPHGSIPSVISELTGITHDMVKDKPYFEDVVDAFMAFLGEDDIVGHNLSFDLNFLSACGAPMYTSGFTFLDTLKLSRERFVKGVDIENHRLCTMCSYYGIEIEHSHRASDDALASGVLFGKLINEGKK